MGVYKIVVEIPEGWGVILVVKKWKFQGGGGGLREIPSVVGVWIFYGTTHCWCPIAHMSSNLEIKLEKLSLGQAYFGI